MNFLSHYYLLPEKDQAEKVLGNLIPDLLRGFTKIYNEDLKERKEIHHYPLIQGIHFHLQTDAIFHELSFFHESCALVKSKIVELKLPEKKSYMLAHIMVELILDQNLMLQEDNLAESFYQSLADIEKNVESKLNKSFQLRESSKISTIFKGFIENKYAFALKSPEGIISACHHIIGKKLDLDLKSKKWCLLVEEIGDELRPQTPKFLKELNDKLQNA